MRAMILAAGRGERMRPLTDTLPKPLLQVGGKPLIVWQIERLLSAGISDIVINHAWLGEVLVQTLGSGSDLAERWKIDNPHNVQLQLHYSAEVIALETAGGIATALPLLSTAGEAFAVVNGDVWCDFPLSRLPGIAAQMQASQLQSWSVMVANPSHHPTGDFAVENGHLVNLGTASQASFTFSGIGVYSPKLFATTLPGKPAKLAPLLRGAATTKSAGAEIHYGAWHDIGTVERLAQLDAQLRLPKES